MRHGRRTFGAALTSIGLIAFGIRFAVRAVRGSADFETNGYTFFLKMARFLAEGAGYTRNGVDPTAFRVPLYPIFLALTGGEEGNFWLILLAQSALSAATVVVTGLIARRLFSEPVAMLAATIAMLWPYAMAHDTALQESGLFAFLTMLALWLLLTLHEQERGRGWIAVAIGVVLGLAILTRATLLPFATLAIGWMLLPATASSATGLQRIGLASLASAALLATLTPWLIYADQTVGAPVLGTESGAALFTANHPQTFKQFPEQNIDRSRWPILRANARLHGDELRSMPELERDRWFRERAWSAIIANPERTLSYAAMKIWAAFGPQKVPRTPRIFNGIYVITWTPILLLGLTGFWLARADWRRGLLFWGLIGTFSAVTALFWSQTSHKAYLDYTFIIFAAYALSCALSSQWLRSLLAPAPQPVQWALQYFAADRAQHDR